MKKLIALVLTLMFTLTAVAALAEAPATTDTPSRTLVIYYSATGSTERIANMIAEETGADVFVMASCLMAHGCGRNISVLLLIMFSIIR